MSHSSDRRAFLAVLAAMPFVPGMAARAATVVHTPIAKPAVTRVSAAGDRLVTISRWEARGARKGIIAFSHGFGSSPGYYPDFIAAWTAAGYDIIAPLHTDSREYEQPGKYPRTVGWATRIEDMRAVSRIIDGNYIAAGHSFGALTALALCGTQAVVPAGIEGPLVDPHATSAIAFSPPGPLPSLIWEAGFAGLARPALIQTGTLDIPMTPGTPAVDGWRAHLAAFDKAPASGDHYGLLLQGVDHFFGGLICDYSKTGPDQRAALDVAIRYSLAFLAAQANRSVKAPHWPASPLARLMTR